MVPSMGFLIPGSSNILGSSECEPNGSCPRTLQEPVDGVLASPACAFASHACFDPMLGSLFLISYSTSGAFSKVG